MASFFICSGCGARIQINETEPRQRPFVWHDAQTDKPRPYCYDCDDKLISGVPITPKEQQT